MIDVGTSRGEVRERSTGPLAAVSRLRMVAVDLFARLANLLDDEEAVMPLDDALDLLELVAGDDKEAVALRGDPLVLGRSELHVLEAGGLAALAVEGGRRRQLMALRALLDPLVDATEDLLVARRSLGKFHRAIIAEFAHRRRRLPTAGSSASASSRSFCLIISPFRLSCRA
jgi:hypothetical protein